MLTGLPLGWAIAFVLVVAVSALVSLVALVVLISDVVRTWWIPKARTQDADRARLKAIVSITDSSHGDHV